MRHFLRFLCGLVLFVGYSSADNLQNFIDGVAKIQRLYERKEISETSYWKAIGALADRELTVEDKSVIEQIQIPSDESIPGMRQKHWTNLERKFFAKILLLALDGCPLEASTLLEALDSFLLRSDLNLPPVVPTHHPWIILLNCISISHWRCVRDLANHCVQILSDKGYGVTPEWDKWLRQEVNTQVQNGTMETYNDAVSFCDTFILINHCVQILSERGYEITSEGSDWLWQEVRTQVKNGTMKTYDDVVSFCNGLIYKN